MVRAQLIRSIAWTYRLRLMGCPARASWAGRERDTTESDDQPGRGQPRKLVVSEARLKPNDLTLDDIAQYSLAVVLHHPDADHR